MELNIDVGAKSYKINSGETLFDLIKKNMPNARFGIVGAKHNNELIELITPITNDMKIEWVSSAGDEGVKVLRHSASHIMATAVKKLFPDVKISIGPATDDGFYYDFDLEHRFNEEDFAKIEGEMQKIVESDLPFLKSEIDIEDAIQKFKNEGEIYKIELLEELRDQKITLYTNGGFTDLCRGPHVPTTGYIKAFKLLKIAGAYWRGDEKNKMLQRIYGTAFSDSKSLKQYLTMVEEAKERDHRKIGKEMGLFGFYPEGPGFPFWKPNGMVLYNTVLEYWRAIHKEEGYVEVKTPIILNEDLWHRSGHWDKYKENMYFTEIDNETYAVKPMNCPGGLLIFKDGLHSYKELPLKIAELGLVHRHEKSGVLHGLFRVRQFTQDDAHIYCMEEQVKDEVKSVVRLIQKIYSDFGFNDVALELSTRPANSIGSDEIWEISEKALEESLNELGLQYKLNPGDGAFYGPKIDFHVKDAIGRSWQCGTIQCDFSMPERFDISYIGQDGQKHRPVMLHRAILGSIERFIGIIIEHFKGKFPFWLATEQIRVLPISKKHHDYAKNVKNMLQNFNFRVNIDETEDKLGGKIKNARLDRCYFVLIIGDNEVENRTITLRKADKEENVSLTLENVVNYLNDIRESKV